MHKLCFVLFCFPCHAVKCAELPLTGDQTCVPCSESTVLLLKKYIYLFMAALGLHCCVGLSLVAVSGDYFLVVVCRLVLAMASLVAEHGL